jgi:hypothetical protein
MICIKSKYFELQSKCKELTYARGQGNYLGAGSLGERKSDGNLGKEKFTLSFYSE